MMRFQFLIGRLATHDFIDVCAVFLELFQFLIGRLATPLYLLSTN
jgi:hypothetical protein